MKPVALCDAVELMLQTDVGSSPTVGAKKESGCQR